MSMSRIQSVLPRRQKGFFNQITAATALVVFGLLMAIQSQTNVLTTRKDVARSTGVTIGQVKSAIRAHIAKEGLSTPTGTFNGLNWLKDSGTCATGTASEPYLKCGFVDQLPFGLSYRTTVSRSGNIVTARTVIGAPMVNGQAHRATAETIVTSINGAANDFVTPVTQTFHSAEADDSTAVITMEVSNSPQNNEFLRRDGVVTGTGDFDWGGFDLNNIGNANINGSVNADNVNTNSVNATGDITAGGRVTATGNITGNTVFGTGFFDTNIIGGTQYFVNPSSTSRFRSTITSEGQLNTAQLRITNRNTEGDFCPSSSAIGISTTGGILECVGSRWRKPGGTPEVRISYNTRHTNFSDNPRRFSIGWHHYCAVAGQLQNNSGDTMRDEVILLSDPPDSQGRFRWDYWQHHEKSTQWSRVICWSFV